MTSAKKIFEKYNKQKKGDEYFVTIEKIINDAIKEAYEQGEEDERSNQELRG